MCAALAALVLTAPGAVAQDTDCPVLDLSGPVKSRQFAGFISAFQDPDWQLGIEELSAAGAGRFNLLETHIPGFGYTRSKIWLRICARNTTADVTDWRFYAHENFFQVYEVYVVHGDGRIDTAVHLQPDSPFSSRPIADPELLAPMSIAPGEAVTLYIAYWSGGSSQLDFSMETKSSYDAIASAKTAKDFFFYGMMMLLMAVALVALLMFRHPVFLAYIAYWASALLFVMHGDGVAFQYLWPALPGFNSNATIVTGSCLIVFGATYARIFLRTWDRHPWTDRVLLGFILLTLALDAVLFVPDPQLLKKILVMVSLASFLSCIAAGFIAYFSGTREARFYLIAWLSVVVSSLLMNLRHVLGLEIPQETVHDSMRAVLVFDAMMMGLAIADRFNQLRKSRQAALEENLTTARHYLDLNQRFADLQSQHELAVELSKSRDHDFQNVIHDLRQPLHALRLNIVNLNTGAPPKAGGTQTIETAFSYLENLISEHLAAPPEVRRTADETQDNAPGLQDILGAIEEMFAPDAESKGLSLRFVRTGLDVQVNPLVLTRIVSNLVANAIKYTDTGGVLIGTRRQGGSVLIEVHDTGPGLSRAEFDQARERNVRLDKNRDAAEGSGLGLSIVIGLTHKHGLDLRLSRMRRGGTGMVVVVPPGAGSGGVRPGA